MSSLESIIVVTGPTASGKTDLAIDIAEKFNLEIVNADSVQIYEDFNIGAAKPSAEELNKIKHHLISYIDPESFFSAAQFLNDAKSTISSLETPIIAGGTGLYIKALLHDLAATKSITTEARNKLSVLEEKYQGENLKSNLFQYLKQIDPKSAEKLNINDIQRIKRALLVKLSSGDSLKELQDQHDNKKINYRALLICLLPDREQLYQRINKRVDKMLEQGLVKETENLLQKYNSHSKPFGVIGYKQVLQYLKGDISYEQMRESIQQETRNFAKRQFTWWRNQPEGLSWDKISLKTAENKGLIGVLPKEAIFDSVSRYLSREASYSFDKIWFLPVNFVF